MLLSVGGGGGKCEVEEEEEDDDEGMRVDRSKFVGLSGSSASMFISRKGIEGGIVVVVVVVIFGLGLIFWGPRGG